jgi:hypothetical protein
MGADAAIRDSDDAEADFAKRFPFAARVTVAPF